jgi:hypothetical protein
MATGHIRKWLLPVLWRRRMCGQTLRWRECSGPERPWPSALSLPPPSTRRCPGRSDDRAPDLRARHGKELLERHPDAALNRSLPGGVVLSAELSPRQAVSPASAPPTRSPRPRAWPQSCANPAKPVSCADPPTATRASCGLTHGRQVLVGSDLSGRARKAALYNKKLEKALAHQLEQGRGSCHSRQPLD